MTVQPFTQEDLAEMVEDAERAMADLEAMLDLGPGSAVPLLECVVCGEPVLARRLDAEPKPPASRESRKAATSPLGGHPRTLAQARVRVSSPNRSRQPS